MDIRVLVFNSGTFKRAELSKMSEQELWQLWEKDDDQAQVQMYYLDEFSCAFNDEEVSDQDWLYFVDYDNVKKEDAEPKNELFVRLGIYINPTDEELDKILKGDTEVMQQVIREKRYEIGGDTYLPAHMVETYNEEHHTNYDIDDIGFEQYGWCE